MRLDVEISPVCARMLYFAGFGITQLRSHDVAGASESIAKAIEASKEADGEIEKNPNPNEADGLASIRATGFIDVMLQLRAIAALAHNLDSKERAS